MSEAVHHVVSDLSVRRARDVRGSLAFAAQPSSVVSYRGTGGAPVARYVRWNRACSVSSPDLLQIDGMLSRLLQNVELVTAHQSEAAEFFELPPLSAQRVQVKVVKCEPARFYFVEEAETAVGGDED